MSMTFDRGALSRVIAMINNKGGVGKTTLTANIGGLLAASGWKVLLVDLDHQGNLGLDLGYQGQAIDDDGEALSNALMNPGGSEITPLPTGRNNLDVLVGGRRMETAGSELSAMMREGRRVEARMSVAEVLSPIAGDYDIVLLDCPPGNEAVQAAAVAASRYVLIPTRTDEASVRGLTLTATRIDEVQDLNPDVDLLGVILFGTGQSAKNVREGFIKKASDELGGSEARQFVFKSFVTHAEATAREAREQGLLVHELEKKVRSGPKWYDRIKAGTANQESAGPRSATSVAESMQNVTEELIERLTAAEVMEAAQ